MYGGVQVATCQRSYAGLRNVIPDCAASLGGAWLLTPRACEGITDAMLIFKILRTDEWRTLRKEGETTGAPIDVSDGYIHLSTAAQVAETAAKHFAGAEGLFLLALEADTLGDTLKWEVSRGGAEFPHLYRKLAMEDVVWAQPLPLVDGVHEFPAGLTEAAQ
jgi:uncharacterized protein (DUF952 family)